MYKVTYVYVNRESLSVEIKHFSTDDTKEAYEFRDDLQKDSACLALEMVMEAVVATFSRTKEVKNV